MQFKQYIYRNAAEQIHHKAIDNYMAKYVDKLNNTTKYIARRSTNRFSKAINKIKEANAAKHNIKYVGPGTTQGSYQEYVWNKRSRDDNNQVKWQEEEKVMKGNKNKYQYDPMNYEKTYIERNHTINYSDMTFPIGLAFNHAIAGIEVPPAPTINNESKSGKCLRNRLIIGISTNLNLYNQPQQAKITDFQMKIDVKSLVYIYK